MYIKVKCKMENGWKKYNHKCLVKSTAKND